MDHYYYFQRRSSIPHAGAHSPFLGLFLVQLQRHRDTVALCCLHSPCVNTPWALQLRCNALFWIRSDGADGEWQGANQVSLAGCVSA
jgi:hypothetical protein